MSIDIDKLEADARDCRAERPEFQMVADPGDILALINRLREAEGREQALAAHVERVQDRARLITDRRQWEGNADPRVPHVLLDNLSDACMDALANSLARRDARMKTEELERIERYEERVGIDCLGGFIYARICELRRQSERGESCPTSSPES
ncbi:hypothetical protein RSO41_06185 [Halomonas sp. I1]|uniref:hypothetical protein n=1 Tax=Halomonas sp. I1 TaxID=393536 RepID=UPI0028DE0D29|nr:hypothetical protein [Halomonas sp. I1]MDT8894239.1 hypothetical protein [Halomonas sp. I1]